jgi:hypothetical protein
VGWGEPRQSARAEGRKGRWDRRGGARCARGRRVCMRAATLLRAPAFLRIFRETLTSLTSARNKRKRRSGGRGDSGAFFPPFLFNRFFFSPFSCFLGPGDIKFQRTRACMRAPRYEDERVTFSVRVSAFLSHYTPSTLLPTFPPSNLPSFPPL